MNSNLPIIIIFSAAGFGFIYMLIGAAKFTKRGSRRGIYRFDNNTNNGGADSIDHYDSFGSDFGDCGDSGGGDGGCDG